MQVGQASLVLIIVLVAYYGEDPLQMEAKSCEFFGVIPHMFIGAGAHFHCIDRIAYYVVLHALAYHYGESLIAYARFSSKSWKYWRGITALAFIGACCAGQLFEVIFAEGAALHGGVMIILLHVVRNVLQTCSTRDY